MIEQLSQFDKDLLLRWFLYYLPQGCDGPDMTKATRTEFKREFPAVYNRLYGKTVKVMQGDIPA